MLALCNFTALFSYRAFRRPCRACCGNTSEHCQNVISLLWTSSCILPNFQTVFLLSRGKRASLKNVHWKREELHVEGELACLPFNYVKLTEISCLRSSLCISIYVYAILCASMQSCIYKQTHTSSTTQSGGGSSKDKTL